MYTNTLYPALETVSQAPNQEPVISYTSGGSREVYRSDTIRRRKPMPLQETSVFTSVQDLRHGSIHYSRNGYYYRNSTETLGLLGRPTTGDLYSNGLIVCENKLRALARSSGVNLAMMLAEYRQTASLFGELAGMVVNLYRSVRRGNFKRAFNTYRRSKDWLRFQYGVRPLMSDMYQSYEELRSAKIPSHRVEVTHTVRDSYKKSAYYISPANIYNADFYTENRIRSYANVTFNDSLFQASVSRHGLTNPALLAWELIPYSFVVDWWINVGEVLESLDNCLILSSLNGGISQKILEIVTIEGTNAYYRYSYKIRGPKGFSLVNSFTYKPSVSLQHILNGLALLRTIR